MIAGAAQAEAGRLMVFHTTGGSHDTEDYWKQSRHSRLQNTA